jgi:hypothetical protein
LPATNRSGGRHGDHLETDGRAHDQTTALGTTIPLTTLFTYSANSGDSIVGFDVEDETSGGGYLTNNGTIEQSGVLYGNTATGIPISLIAQWAFVTGSAGVTGTIGFNVDDASGDNSSSAYTLVTGQQPTNWPAAVGSAVRSRR